LLEPAIEDNPVPVEVEHLTEITFVEVHTKQRGTALNAHFFPDTEKAIIQAGSIIANDVVPSFAANAKANRDELKNKHCELEGDKWIVKTPIEFSSPSGAIQFGVGSNINGWTNWLIVETNKSLQTLRENNQTVS